MFYLNSLLRMFALSLVMFVSSLAVGQNDTITIKEFSEVKTLLDSFSNGQYSMRIDKTSRYYLVDSIIVDSVNANLGKYDGIYHVDYDEL